MYKHLFFDDQRLFVRQGLHREYGVPEQVGTFQDPNLTSPYGWCYALRGLDGNIHLLYNGFVWDENHNAIHGFGAAISEDGIHFQPRNTAQASGFDNPLVPNQILPPSPQGSEIAVVLEDPQASPEERYKMLFCDNAKLQAESRIQDRVLTSPDLFRWHPKEGACWNPVGTEPITGAFYNPAAKAFTILTRPDWGQRRVAITDTSDWMHFSPLELCLQCDSLDEPLAEVYGMPAMEYDGWFIGFPLLFSGFPQGIFNKYSSGEMRVQLAYSLNGHHWQRSLHVPFLEGDMLPDGPWKMTFISSVLREKSGSLLLYVCASHKQHGTPPAQMIGNAAIQILRLRQDGFIRLVTHGDTPGVLALRDTLWKGGPLRINLQAKHATCAIYEYNTNGEKAWLSHEDCIPFQGDSTQWTPQWRKGSLDELQGKLLNIEVRLQNGALYSIAYDGTPMMFAQALRYHRFGTC
ncbi:MAG: hypothetical protein IJJ26_01680 [Victivallales bacterium]|nr:hypothetical protein [Victivallales bacterium]